MALLQNLGMLAFLVASLLVECACCCCGNARASFRS